MAKITQHQLARKLGVSRSTVAAALNPASTIKLNEATRQRILEAARELDYRPDRYARVMRGGKSGMIGILHFGGLLQVAAERAFHAAAALRTETYEVVAADLSWSVESVEAACSSLVDARVEGVIVAGMTIPSEASNLGRLREEGIPVVALSGNPLDWAPHFRGDTRLGIYDLTRHLLALGHRRLSLFTHISTSERDAGDYIWAGSERVKGFSKALIEAGGKIVERFSARAAKAGDAPTGTIAPCALPSNPFDPFTPGYEGMKAILRGRQRPQAVLCSNDEIAIGAMRACRELGVSIPGELAITGYDDIALSAFCEVPLTTVRQPNQAMAEAAVTSLLRMIDGETIPPSRRLQLFPCEVIVRRSCGAL